MERTLALVLLSLLVAGCASPDPAAPGQGSALGDVYVPPEDAPAPTLPLDGAPAGPPAAVAPASPSDAGTAPSSSSPGSAPSAPPPSSPQPSTPGRARAEVPQLRIGDAWTYRGVNTSGARFEEVRRVAELAWRGNVPVYVMDVTVGDRRLTEDVTRAGLDTINGTGFVTELLRFPFEAGSNWTFTWSDDGTVSYTDPDNASLTATGGWHHWLRGDVAVLGQEKLPLLSGNWDAFHLRCTLTTGLGSYTREVVLDYWYAPAAKAIARVESTRDGATTWSELAEARV
jgi:hypothetical protein